FLRTGTTSEDLAENVAAVDEESGLLQPEATPEPPHDQAPPPMVEPVVALPPSSELVRPPVMAARPVSPPVDERELIRERLSQRVLRFKQIEPASFDALRLQLSEFGGVSIEYETDELSDRYGDAPVSLSATNATLAELLSKAASQAGL